MNDGQLPTLPTDGRPSPARPSPGWPAKARQPGNIAPTGAPVCQAPAQAGALHCPHVKYHHSYPLPSLQQQRARQPATECTALLQPQAASATQPACRAPLYIDLVVLSSFWNPFCAGRQPRLYCTGSTGTNCFPCPSPAAALFPPRHPPPAPVRISGVRPHSPCPAPSIPLHLPPFSLHTHPALDPTSLPVHPVCPSPALLALPAFACTLRGQGRRLLPVVSPACACTSRCFAPRLAGL